MILSGINNNFHKKNQLLLCIWVFKDYFEFLINMYFKNDNINFVINYKLIIY